MCVLSWSAALLDWLLLRQRAVLPGRGQRRGDGPPAGRRPHVHEQAEEGGRQGLRLLCYPGETLAAAGPKDMKAVHTRLP